TPPGHARTARAQGALARADARLGAGAADRADEPRRVPREPGLALPGAAADEAQGVDPLGVAGDGEQPTRSLLHADAVGRAAARAGACGVGARVACGELGAGVGRRCGVSRHAPDSRHESRPTPAAQRHSPRAADRKSTRLNSSHVKISYAVL